MQGLRPDPSGVERRPFTIHAGGHPLNTIVRIALFLTGGLTLPLAAGFLLMPARAALRLGLEAAGPVGMSTLRGDFLGIFVMIGGSAIYAAVRNRSDVLIIPLIMLSVIIAGRLVSAVLDGSGRDALPLIGAEVMMLAVVVLGYRTLP
jgi:hypothetical protein